MMKTCNLIVTLMLLQFVVPDQDCQGNTNFGRTVNLSINSKRNETGEWITTFSAKKDLKSSPNNISLDVTHKVIECNGKQMLHILGVIKDHSDYNETFLFHPRCGKNIAVINKGLTVKKLNSDEPFDSVAFTNRPLKDNELFEVRLDQKINKFHYSLGIGITAHSPYDVVIPKEMYYMPQAWMMHHNNVYENKRPVFQGYPVNLNNIKVGERVGVMRSNFGTLHFFYNGVDLGPAASNIPYPIYGVFELWQDATVATIVSSTPSTS